MKEKRRFQNKQMKGIAVQMGLQTGSEIIVRERSMLKDCSYITRQVRKGVVLELYDYHFYCCMADGSKESFRYNELLGDEARLIRIKGKRNNKGAIIPKEKRDIQRDVSFYTRAEGFEPSCRLPDLSDFESSLLFQC